MLKLVSNRNLVIAAQRIEILQIPRIYRFQGL